MTTSVEALVRPRLRGVIHEYATAAFAGAFLVLTAIADGPPARGWITVYGLSIIAMLTVSAVYHSHTFECHELFYRLVGLAAAAHFTAVTLIVLGPA